MPQLEHMVWQPIVDLTTETILGYEALARFDVVSPLVAFSQLHDPAAVIALDRHCIALALAHPPPDGLLFLNVTAATVQSGHWPTIPHDLRDRVVWELPEAAGWEPAMIPDGLTLALDDVGTGFAELVRLAQVPWHYLKVDRSLIAGIARHAGQALLVRDLVARARDRGGFVIAEGLEQAADAGRLNALGVSYGQGFLWGPPRKMASSLLPPRFFDTADHHF